jgi:hypothetical protein
MDTIETAKEQLFDKFENYTKTSIELVKLNAIDKTADVTSSLTSGIFISLVVSMFILFVNIGLSLYLGKILGDYYYGFFIVSGFYLFISIILYFFRHQLIKRPVSDAVLDKLLKKTDLNAILNSESN